MSIDQEKERLQRIAAAKQAAAEARRARAAAARAAHQPPAGVGAAAAVVQPASIPAAAGAPPRPGPVQVTSYGVGVVLSRSIGSSVLLHMPNEAWAAQQRGLQHACPYLTEPQHTQYI